jgi:hypothetical protein
MPTGKAGTPGPGQLFDFGRYRYDIDAAQALLRALPRSPVQVPVATLQGFFGLGIVMVAAAYAAGTDLTEPLILAPLPDVTGALVIDGWHRVWRALDENVPALPGYLLTADEVASIRTRIC